MNSPNLQSLFLLLLLALPVHMLTASEADVLDVQIQRAATGAYRIDVTVQHADSGWDHYADRWDGLRLMAACWAPAHCCTRTSMNGRFTTVYPGCDFRQISRQLPYRAHDSVRSWRCRDDPAVPH